MNQIARTCTDVVLLDNGQCKYQGEDVARGITLCEEKFDVGDRREVGTGEVKLENCYIIGGNKTTPNGAMPRLNLGESIELGFELSIASHIRLLALSVVIWNQQMR